MLDRPQPENLFVPLVAPSAPLTPGLGHAFGAGRRMPVVRRAGEGADAIELIGDLPGPSPHSGAYVQMERAVEEVFADLRVSRAPSAELIRPYIEHSDEASVWAGVGVVPPPTPVLGVGVGDAAVRARVSMSDHPRSEVLPTRRELRERRKAEESARTAATRRLAKGGVLAVAMLGVVASQAPQALHQRLFGATDTTDPAAATLVASEAVRIDTASLPRDSVEDTLRQQLIKKDQIQKVSLAAQDAGGVLVAVAKAQAASDEAARQAARDRANREAQRNPQALARLMVGERGWSASQFVCLKLLWTRESRWNYRASNPSSGAYGIPQALPGAKMASAGSDWRTNPATQIEWGLDYIADRYGSPCSAWAHSERNNWY